MRITRGFSLTNFVIATSALTFQVFVLYPWHARLDEDFTQLKIEHLNYLQEGEKKRLEELKGIRMMQKIMQDGGFGAEKEQENTKTLSAEEQRGIDIVDKLMKGLKTSNIS